MKKFTFIIFTMMGALPLYAQTPQLYCAAHADMGISNVYKQKVYTYITIPQTNGVKGYLEHLPLGYDPNDPQTKYPLILVLHELGEFGDGTATSMCKFFDNKYQLYPYIRIENNAWPTTLPTAPNENSFSNAHSSVCTTTL